MSGVNSSMRNVLLALILIRKFLTNRAFVWEQHVPSIESCFGMETQTLLFLAQQGDFALFPRENRHLQLKFVSRQTEISSLPSNFTEFPP